MTDDERAAFEQAVAEEQAAKAENVAASGDAAMRLRAEAAIAMQLIALLKTEREAAGVSLSEMETRTGMQKSALSRLENSAAPNPMLSTLQRYAAAIGKRLDFAIESGCDP
ncbi:helix-turn-helix protein [Rosistilla oblonga]|uniref:Helix-turn-helix protein n=2 Tax=Rosistilla oblonga TaxID=2527990 RepID=A0A518IMD2_9BACT|nr:helix-turn-helix protein [Rosistilla oblonga]